MQNIPKIVRERLNAASAVVRPDASSSAHPDADLLTAFAERSLLEFERAAVLEHLSRCGDCREVVALALPASEEVSGPVLTGVRTSSRGWLSWPALRWAFVAAGVAVIAAVGVLRYQRGPSTMALKQSSHLEVAANEPKKQDLDRLVAPEPKEKEKLQVPAAAPAVADSRSASSPAARDSAAGDSVAGAKKSASQAEGSASHALTFQTKNGTNSIHGGAFAANALPYGPRVANHANQWQQQNALRNNVQTTAPVAPPPSAYPAQAVGQVAATTEATTASEPVEVASAAPVIADQAADQATVRAKAPVASVAVPASPATSGAAGAMVNRHDAGGSVGGL